MSEEQQVAQEAAPAEPQSPDFESEAKAQGWVPKEEFRGSDTDWVDAETFVRRGKEIMPILRKNNEKLLKELSEAKKAAEEARSVAKEFREFQKQQFEKKTKELEVQLEQLKQAKRDAISTGDGDRVLAIDDAIDEIKEQRIEAKQELKQAEEQVKKVEQPAITADPILNDWLGRNEWFGQDVRLTGIANGLGEALRKENPSLQGKAFLDKLDEELEAIMPDKLGKKKQTFNPMEGSPTTNRPAPTSSKKKSYDNLPEEAKKACDRFVSQKLMTREQYVSEYDWN